jgi:hypothetical protein
MTQDNVLRKFLSARCGGPVLLRAGVGRVGPAALLAVVLALAAGAAQASAATLTVQNTLDSGAGSLRQVLGTANTGDVIQFASGVSGTIMLLSEVTIPAAVTIQGPGASTLTIDGQHANQIFAVGGTVASGTVTTNATGEQSADAFVRFSVLKR